MEIDTPSIFRPIPKYPIYPPYHTGLYLEDYFIDFWKNNKIKTDRHFIAISWTSYYNNNEDRNVLTQYLKSLNKHLKYFTVCQHDDAPFEKLPDDTYVFCAGGNYNGPNKVDIPLICSELPVSVKTHIDKNIFCSFVGSLTHKIRKDIYTQWKDDKDFYLKIDTWSPIILENKLNSFLDTTLRSKYTLCPRGYGTSSFRLYECFQLNSVPVYISDVHSLPWSDEIDWNEFCVVVTDKQIGELKTILENISDTKYQNMLNSGKEFFSKYFTLESVCKNITKRI